MILTLQMCVKYLPDLYFEFVLSLAAQTCGYKSKLLPPWNTNKGKKNLKIHLSVVL